MFDFYTYGVFAYLCQNMEIGVPLGLLCALSVILCMAVGYFLGSVNTSIIISKLFFGEDVRNYGSGNAGMTNVLRTYGKKSAALTLLGDVLKTVIAIVIGRFIGFPVMFAAIKGELAYGVSISGYITALFCTIGHTFPAYYKFKGGKGVLCAAAAVAMLSPLTFVWLMIIFIIIVAGTKFVSLGSVIAVMLYPILLDRIEGTSIVTVIAFLIMALVVYNHRTNIKRLLEGTENKISIGKKDKAKTDEGK